MYVSDYNHPSSRLLEGIQNKIDAAGHEPRVVIELDKMTYVSGLRRKYDAVKYVQESVVSDLLSIDKAEKLTEYIPGTHVPGTPPPPEVWNNTPTELQNVTMSMPIIFSSTLRGKSNSSRTIQGMFITDWHDSDPRCSRKNHNGIDFDLVMNDPVHAVWAGRVTEARAMNGYGKVVYIDHGNGWQTRYAHLNSISVNRGEQVSAGDIIGLGGNTGLSISSQGGDGTHLHFEVRLNGTDLNPEPFLRRQKSIQLASKTPKTTATTPPPAPISGGYVEYHVEATAYTATCKGCTGITKGGTDVRKWEGWKIIAVDPSLIPLKSKVELIVEGVSWGIYDADDIGGDIKGNRIDILMETTQKAYTFGRKDVVIRVQSWGDGKERTLTGDYGKEIVTYQVNRTTSKQTYSKDFTAKRTTLPPKKYPILEGAEQFLMNETKSKMHNVLGFRKTNSAGHTKKIVFEHEWINAGNLSWAYNAELGIHDVITVRVDDYPIVQISGASAKNGVAYPPSIPVPKGKHKVVFSFANSANASSGRFGLLWLKAKEFDVETIEAKQLWSFVDNMNSSSKWTANGNVSLKDKGDYQAISTKGGEAGIERSKKITKFPFTMNLRVKVATDTIGRVYLSNGKKGFMVTIRPDGISAQGGGAYSIDNQSDFVEYTIVCHDDTDMDVYVRRNEEWVNTDVRGTSYSHNANQILLVVSKGTMFIDDVKYAFNNYAIEQFATRIGDMYSEKWYEVGDFEFEEMFTVDKDVISWEVNAHMDTSSSTARITLDNGEGIYSPMWQRNADFPSTYKKKAPPLSFWEGGELCHVISEGTPIRIYAGFGNELVRVFTGMIKGEIEENAKERTISFSCVDRFDMIEEHVLYRPKSYPPEDTLGSDGGAFAWIKSSIVEDIAVESGITTWKVHAEDFAYPDYDIDDTVYIDVNKSEGTFMKFNKSTGELDAVSQEAIKKVGGWENPFVASVTFPVGTRSSDAIHSLIQDMPYRVFCNRYGTFMMKRMDFLDDPDWLVKQGTKWEFTGDENLFELNSSTDYSRVRNHLMISGTSGLVEHFFDKSLIIATKGNIRTAGMNLNWLDEVDGASMRGLKQEIANKVFFDIKRQARTKNVVVKGNPLIELLDTVYVHNESTYTANHYIVKGHRLVGSNKGIVSYLELTWQLLT
ncbi:peptidoglycan DD-metalloendopeptidase family protein [Paenibacillus arenosi]|uniref:Peptidoglycan DD-metalloendopeptidase family protein n=1 Tax=Paenibacillus arenosi TaxID=2774142 RepID=A0ABR9AXN0_9BACL|nr:peptidoglycan DD-metalloendopeptidase family protein [Paenibacillus arenosi]MBD8498887.1 peptidoglycan DD-metalloendopeptidase family protein [Paenibacillus arenosi]